MLENITNLGVDNTPYYRKVSPIRALNILLFDIEVFK